MRWLALALLCLAGPLQAQELAEAPGAKLRILDKLTGEVQDVTLARGQAVVTGRLTVQLDSCRSPADNTVAEADAHLTILDAASTAPVFAGWMLATALGGWVTAVALGVLVREPMLYLGVCTVALFALFALPGWILFRDARAVPKGA